MINTVIDTIKKYKMLKYGDSVTVALSGGADSVCLLHILCELKCMFKISVDAVHINHCIRGDESDSDERFCISLCEKLNVPLKIYRIDVPKIAENSDKSLEETARDIRYDKFSECVGSYGKIATAHTLSDSAETAIFNLIRGTGIKGLCGIPPVRDNIIRPLACVTRFQVEAYLKDNEQDFVTDSSNLSDDYTRNKIRHNIMPIMLDINKRFYKNFANLQNILREENEYLEMQAEEIYSKYSNNNILSISDCPSALKKRVIIKFLEDNNLPINFEKINQIAALTEKNGKINIIKDTFIIGYSGRIFLEKKYLIPEEREILLEIGNNSIFDNIIFKAEVINKYEENNDLVDLDKISGKIILRNRRFGDKIQLAGRNFNSSVKKLINEYVDYEKRKFIHFLCDDSGLIYMEGFGVSERAKPDKSSKNILKITIEKKESE